MFRSNFKQKKQSRLRTYTRTFKNRPDLTADEMYKRLHVLIDKVNPPLDAESIAGWESIDGKRIRMFVAFRESRA